MIESAKLLLGSSINYEFRTTTVPGFTEHDDIINIAKSIAGAKAYYLQQFVPHNTLDPSLGSLKPYPIELLATIKKEIDVVAGFAGFENVMRLYKLSCTTSWS